MNCISVPWSERQYNEEDFSQRILGSYSMFRCEELSNVRKIPTLNNVGQNSNLTETTRYMDICTLFFEEIPCPRDTCGEVDKGTIHVLIIKSRTSWTAFTAYTQASKDSNGQSKHGIPSCIRIMSTH